MMAAEFNWGILGTGKIAGKFAEGLSRATGARLLAVGSRTVQTAEEFGTQHEIPRRYGTYEALVQDPDLDVVYISSPHAFHHEHSLLALRAGKAVLCEKPFTINAAEAGQLVREARERSLFLMEAMWTRFLPVIVELRRMLLEQVIGAPQALLADFGIRREPGTSDRLFRLELGGGALLDLGVYLVSLASMLFGEPDHMSSLAAIGGTGVDERASFILGYASGAQACLFTAIRNESPKEAVILGKAGSIRIHAPVFRPDHLTLTLPDGTQQPIERPVEANGMHYEAQEVMRCLDAGLTESPVMPLDESVSIMRTLDAIRKPWNLRYPADERSLE
jgi:predicted dehydrogenase